MTHGSLSPLTATPASESLEGCKNSSAATRSELLSDSKAKLVHYISSLSPTTLSDSISSAASFFVRIGFNFILKVFHGSESGLDLILERLIRVSANHFFYQAQPFK